MKATKWTLVVALLLVTLWAMTSWYVSDQFLSLGIVDYSETEELEILSDLNIANLERRTVEIRSGNVLLAGSFFQHPTPSDCAVVLLPGIGGHRTQVLPALPLFWELGCHVLTYDPRGTGASSRVPRTFGFLEKKDNAAAIHWVTQETGVKLSSVGIWGPSFGAAVGILTLDEIKTLGFVIADSTFHSFKQVTYDTIALLSNTTIASIISPGVIYFLEMRTGMNVNSVDPKTSIVGTTTPILLIHAAEDPAMHLSHSQKVFDARTTSNVELEITDWAPATLTQQLSTCIDTGS